MTVDRTLTTSPASEWRFGSIASTGAQPVVWDLENEEAPPPGTSTAWATRSWGGGPSCRVIGPTRRLSKPWRTP